MAVLITEIMEADGQLLWKPRAGHESHLANFSRIAERGGHDGDCLQEQRAQLPGGCGGPDKHQTYGEVACSAGKSRRRGKFMRGSRSGVVWRRHASLGGRHGIVHHWRNTRAQIWWVWILRFLRSNSGVGRVYVALRNSTAVRVEFSEASAGITPPFSFSKTTWSHDREARFCVISSYNNTILKFST